MKYYDVDLAPKHRRTQKTIHFGAGFVVGVIIGGYIVVAAITAVNFF